MLYQLVYPLHTQISALNVIQYITFRTAAAGLTAFVIGLTVGPWTIRTLRGFQIGQIVRDDLTTHQSKAGTPTMGGVLILVAAIVPTLLWVDLTNTYVWVAVLSTVGFGLIGFVDDYLKVVRKTHRGLRPRDKLIGQAVVATAVGFTLLWLSEQGLYSTELMVPFREQFTPDIGWLYVPFAVLVLWFSSNAVNLTDGLDGLAISTFTVAAVATRGIRVASWAMRRRCGSRGSSGSV